MIDEGFRWFLSLVETRRHIKPDTIPGLVQGRVFLGQEALSLKLVDAIGGEDQAVAWLRKEHKVSKDAKVVDWKPQSAGGFGFWSSAGSVVNGLFGQSYVGQMLARDPSLATLGLDGLVSVWHPSEN